MSDDDQIDHAPVADPTEPTPEPTAEPKARRSFLRPGPRGRTVARWSIATVLCLGLGAATAVAVMAPRRTDIPGLATAADGRYTYPTLQLPQLPPGAVGPSAGGAPSGAPGGTVPHAADVRQLLLPHPVGAVTDSTLPGARGFVPLGDFAKLFTSPDDLAEVLGENGARHVAATGWRMPDGTHVTVYLLAFRSGVTSQAAFNSEMGMYLAAAPQLDLSTTDSSVPLAVADTASRPAGKDGPALRVTVFSDADINGLLVMTNPKAVNPVDFKQALTLQMELLGG
ncbi:hypothetical protein [Streptacidiphilus jiangxiensis]|uniref:Uncharacterized protein n=1 Tax=Streptacidiphilus jiangxiensis TaxID=235985 RepID=A0A1H7J3Z0_STRJI|nr:hypothetical protein [Streptacidiphilus jiangxiensis]SEK69471.1 hypothetical protein SAMN05414137_103140 [Streptacidiphilus jiangxiensis]